MSALSTIRCDFLAQPADAPLCSQQLEAGQQITEVEAPYTEIGLSDPEFVHYMSDLLHNYIVDVKSATGRKLLLTHEEEQAKK
jgi:hypothetical protein